MFYSDFVIGCLFNKHVICGPIVRNHVVTKTSISKKSTYYVNFVTIHSNPFAAGMKSRAGRQAITTVLTNLVSVTHISARVFVGKIRVRFVFHRTISLLHSCPRHGQAVISARVQSIFVSEHRVFETGTIAPAGWSLPHPGRATAPLHTGAVPPQSPPLVCALGHTVPRPYLWSEWRGNYAVS